MPIMTQTWGEFSKNLSYNPNDPILDYHAKKIARILNEEKNDGEASSKEAN